MKAGFDTEFEKQGFRCSAGRRRIGHIMSKGFDVHAPAI